jgi:hypothetical protein
VLDPDATVLISHSDKEDASKTWKKTFAVTGVLRDLVDAPTGPSQVGQAQVMKGMCGQLWCLGPRRDPGDDLRPARRAELVAAVATGLAEEQRAVDPSEPRAPLPQVGHQQLRGRGAERHLASALGLGRVGP